MELPVRPAPEVTVHGAKRSLVLCRYLGQGRLSQHSVAIQRHLEAHPHGGKGGGGCPPRDLLAGTQEEAGGLQGYKLGGGGV